jgi:hypothetical protein
MQVGAAVPPGMSTTIVACAPPTAWTVILSPPAGSEKLLPTPSAASKKPARPVVVGVMSSRNVCSPRCPRPRASPPTCTRTSGASTDRLPSMPSKSCGVRSST